MERLTIGQLFDAIIRLSVVAGAVAALYKLLMKGFNNSLDRSLKPIQDDLKEEKIKRLKSDLTTFMYLAEIGTISPEQKMLAHEEYDEYHEKLKKNSYIHDKFEALKKEGKI